MFGGTQQWSCGYSTNRSRGSSVPQPSQYALLLPNMGSITFKVINYKYMTNYPVMITITRKFNVINYNYFHKVIAITYNTCNYLEGRRIGTFSPHFQNYFKTNQNSMCKKPCLWHNLLQVMKYMKLVILSYLVSN